MNIWLKSTSIGLASAIFVFLSPTIFGKKKTATTYDATYRLKVDMLKKNSTMNMVKSILGKRLEDEGHIFSITKSATDSLIVIVKNVADTTYYKKLITANGQLQFREMYTLSEMASAIITGIKIWQTETNETTPPANDTTPVSLSNLMDSNIATTIQKKEPASLIENIMDNPENNPAIGSVKIKDTSVLMELLKKPEIKSLGPVDAVYMFNDELSKQNKKDQLLLYTIKQPDSNDLTAIDNNDIASATYEISETGEYAVSLQFTPRGTQLWADLTRKNTGKFLAIVFNNKVVSAPKVLSEIPGGNTTISGGFSSHDAKLMAQLLSSGNFPAHITLASTTLESAKPPFPYRSLIIAAFTFLLFAGFGFLILKTLKAT